MWPRDSRAEPPAAGHAAPAGEAGKDKAKTDKGGEADKKWRHRPGQQKTQQDQATRRNLDLALQLDRLRAVDAGGIAGGFPACQAAFQHIGLRQAAGMQPIGIVARAPAALAMKDDGLYVPA